MMTSRDTYWEDGQFEISLEDGGDTWKWSVSLLPRWFYRPVVVHNLLYKVVMKDNCALDHVQQQDVQQQAEGHTGRWFRLSASRPGRATVTVAGRDVTRAITRDPLKETEVLIA